MNIKKINSNSKILNVSHYDLDGVCCSISLSNYFKNITCKHATFSNIDNILLKIKYSDYDAVFITDCFPKDPKILEISDKIIVIDHHPQSNILSDFKKIISIPDVCGALLTKNWLETVFNCDLSHLNTLLKYANDYDLWIHNYKKSKMIECLFWKYNFYGFRKRFLTGNIRFTNDELNYIREKRNEFFSTYNNLEIYEFEKIKGCLIFVNRFINDFADKLLHEKDFQIVAVHNTKNNHVSIRTKDENVHIGNILKNLELGGGHPKSGALLEFYSDMNLFKKDLSKLENYLSENVKEWNI